MLHDIGHKYSFFCLHFCMLNITEQLTYYNMGFYLLPSVSTLGHYETWSWSSHAYKGVSG